MSSSSISTPVAYHPTKSISGCTCLTAAIRTNILMNIPAPRSDHLRHTCKQTHTLIYFFMKHGRQEGFVGFRQQKIEGIRYINYSALLFSQQAPHHTIHSVSCFPEKRQFFRRRSFSMISDFVFYRCRAARVLVGNIKQHQLQTRKQKVKLKKTFEKKGDLFRPLRFASASLHHKSVILKTTVDHRILIFDLSTHRVNLKCQTAGTLAQRPKIGSVNIHLHRHHIYIRKYCIRISSKLPLFARFPKFQMPQDPD